MVQFTYTARNSGGQVVTETVEAVSRESLGRELRSQGLMPTSIREKRPGLFHFKLPRLLSHVSLLEKLTFAKNLSVTLKAGLPVSRALAIVVKQMPNPYFRNIVSTVAQDVESGKTMSESMAAYPDVFSAIFVNMVRVGETSGDLDKNLEYLAKQISRDYNLLRRTKGALLYPAVVMVALVAMGYIMFAFVLPKLTSTFTEFNTELPLLTRMIVAMVNIFSHYAILILVMSAAAIIMLLFWRRTPSGQLTMHKLNLTMPVIKTLTKKINLARFTIIFGGLLKSGLPIVEALSVTGHTVTNIYYQRAILEASDKVKMGVDLVTSLERHPTLFTPMITQMIQVGEETGTMEQVLEEVANFYEAEIDDTVKNLSSIIEPVLVIVIGAVVGLLAVGLILPIYNIGQNIQ